MLKKEVAVTIYVDVTVDETKFIPEFMAEFRKNFYDHETLDDHMKHLASLHARGFYDAGEHDRDVFIEGYGPAKNMGIVLESGDAETDIV